jgi:hypothetical protein
MRADADIYSGSGFGSHARIGSHTLSGPLARTRSETACGSVGPASAPGCHSSETRWRVSRVALRVGQSSV